MDGNIDTLITEKIMKVTYLNDLIYKVELEDGCKYSSFRPSTELTHAWKVVEKLQERWNINIGTANSYSKEVGKARELDRYYCEVYGEKTFLEYAETVPMAICKTALKTIGIEIG